MISQQNIDSIIERWPWLTTARVLRMNPSDAAHLRLRLQAWPAPNARGRDNAATQRATQRASQQLHTSIDAFLSSGGDRRIVPREGMTDENAAATSEQVQLQDGMMTEQLAQIFIGQRLFGQAKAIYEHLHLQNPEKSAYFARLIAQCEAAQKS